MLRLILVLGFATGLLMLAGEGVAQTHRAADGDLHASAPCATLQAASVESAVVHAQGGHHGHDGAGGEHGGHDHGGKALGKCGVGCSFSLVGTGQHVLPAPASRRLSAIGSDRRLPDTGFRPPEKPPRFFG